MKKLKITAIICIMVLCLTFAVACEKEQETVVPADFTGFEIVKDLNAYDFYKELETTWHNDTACHRQDYFSFSANKGGLATQQSLFESFRDGDKYFYRNIVLGTSAGKRCDMSTLYNDGTNTYYYKVDDKNIVKRTSKDNDDPFKRDFYTVTDYGTYMTLNDWNAFAEKEVAKDKKTRLTPVNLEEDFKHNFQHVTTYDLSKKENLADSHDDKVYKKPDGTLIFRLTIDCSNEALNNIHTAARDEFLANTGAKNEGFEMLENTTIEITAQKFGDKYKMTSWLRTEQYSGNHATFGLKVACFQQSKCIISYDDYKITNDLIKTALPA